jgi:T5orf172 domain-containing protein
MGTSVRQVRSGTKTPLAAKSKRTMKNPLDQAKAHEVAWDQVSELFGFGRLFADASYVYVIGEENDGPVKIGVARNPILRLRDMQTGNPRRLRIEYVLLGGQPLEKLLHEFWEPFAISSALNRGKANAAPGTEWFRAEIRGELFPIIKTAADRQADYVLDAMSDTSMAGLEQAVRDAHKEHDFVAKGRDSVRLLAQGVGYVVQRPSRI